MNNLNERLLLDTINRYEDLTGRMFHEALPELSHYFERYVSERNFSKMGRLNNELCKRIDEIKERINLENENE